MLHVCIIFFSLILGGSSNENDKLPIRRVVVRIDRVDKENMVITSRDVIESVIIDDMYENTDYMSYEHVEKKKVDVRMLTSRGPLKFIVVTKVSGSKDLTRKHKITVS
jgi:hypothetical protein